MPTFIETCNCRGVRPVGVIGRRYSSRPDIVGSLLKDRHVSRFVIAPTGFGKSNIVYEYANIIFAFEHVFWVKCSSPCFIRDLDAEVLFSNIKTCDINAKLVVFEDVPVMDPQRSLMMSDLINGLLDMECEVIVTCTPSADSFSDLQYDRVVVSPKDLMVTDNELAIEELRGGISENWRDSIAPNERIACNIWSSGGTLTLLKGLGEEDFPKGLKLFILLMLIGRKGSIETLSRFIPKKHMEEMLLILETGYPMLGIEMRTKSFHAFDAGIADIADEFCCRMDEVAAASAFEDRDRLCSAIADWLCDCRQTSRACDVMEVYATKLGSARWLAQKGWKLLVYLDPLSCVKLHDMSRRGATGFYDALSSLKSWASYVLGDTDQAAKFARRLLRSAGARPEDRVSAAILLCMIGDDPSIEDAFAMLRDIGQSDLKGVEAQNVFDIIDWRELAAFARMSAMQKADIIQREYARVSLLEASMGHEAIEKNTYLMKIVWMIHEVVSFCPEATDRIAFFGGCKGDIPAGDMITTAKLAIEIIAMSDDPDLFILLIVMALEDAMKLIPGFSTILSDSRFDVISRKIKMDIYRQRGEYRKHILSDLENKLEFQRSNPDVFRKNEAKPSDVITKSNTPMLFVNLFGGLQVKIGDDPIDAKLLSRQKAKLLLVVLVINKGREVSKSQIMQILWPNADIDSSKRNFYSVWSQLKKALTVNGLCPYLIRTQSGCRIDGRYLNSDISRFDELCRMLLFGSEGSVSWEMLYSQVNEGFAEDLLPSVVGNDEIDHLREKYRESLIDGLIATSSRLNTMGEPRGALWFAREAIRRNDKREDAYIALMEAQISSNQRGSALETYFSCRKFLSEELGIDPSMKVIELYRSIIESEEELD